MAENRKSECGAQKAGTFGDFFECSDIDNQDYSQFINDDSQCFIGQNGNLAIEDDDLADQQKNTQNNEGAGCQEEECQEILMDIKQIMIKEETERQQKLEVIEKIEIAQIQIQQQDQQNSINQPNSEQLLPILSQKKQQNSNNQSSRSKQKKTKETMMIEPLPIFDCMYCIRNCKMIFTKMSESYLSKKYAITSKNHDPDHHRMNEILDDERIQELLKTKNNFSIVEQEQNDDQTQESFLQSSFDLNIMIRQLPLMTQYNMVSFNADNMSPIARTRINNGMSGPCGQNIDSILLTNITQFIPFPTLKVSNHNMDPMTLFLKNKLSGQILFSRAKQNISQGIVDQNYMTQPTLLANEQYISQINPTIFNTMNGHNNNMMIECNNPNIRMKNSNHNMMRELEIQDDEEDFAGPVCLLKWAKTNRQKIIHNISFDSEIHNIYDPRFSSENSSRSISSIARSVYDDVQPVLEIDVDIDDDENYSSNSSSNPSVAEERDTISLTPNAITPNLSRIMNICSISKIEQPSVLTLDSNNTPSIYRNPKSSLSYHNQNKIKKVQYFDKCIFQKSISGKNEALGGGGGGTKFKNNTYVDQMNNPKPQLVSALTAPGNGGFMPQLTNGYFQNFSLVNSIQSNNMQQIVTEANESINIVCQNLNSNTNNNNNNNNSPYQYQLKPFIISRTNQNRTSSTTKSSSVNFKKPSTLTKKSAEKFSNLNTIKKQSKLDNQLTLETNLPQPSLLNRNSSNKLFQLEQSSMFNPYETQQNTPHNNYFDKSTAENRMSILTNINGLIGTSNGYASSGGHLTEIKQKPSKSSIEPNTAKSKAQRTTLSALRNSQSMNNLNLQPRTFITRNVKIRKNNPTNSVANVVIKDMTSPSNHTVINRNMLVSQITTDGQGSPTHLESIQQSSPSRQKESKLQIKRQRLARDILLSKVYNSNLKEPQQFVITTHTHKKTNTTVSNASTLKSQMSKSNLKQGMKKSSLQLENNGIVGASAQDLKGYFNKNIQQDTKRLIKIISKNQTKSMAQNSYNSLPAFNNFLK